MKLPPGRLACALSLLASSALPAAAAARVPPDRQPSCKAVPGTPEWPSAREWSRLNESLAGRLLQPPPPGAVCHPGQAAYDAAECSAVRAAWSTYEFHQADPVSTDWNQWNNDSCLPLDGAPCSPRGYPVFVVNASTPRHVQLGVQFAKKHNIRLVVKSSGHDFLGRSNAPNSLSIWVHHLRGIEVHESFRPSGCDAVVEDGGAVTVGGGTPMWDVYDALGALNLTVVGGGAKSVSVGGYLTGGGHSLLSPWHGLAVDQVLEMDVVTPAGELVTANECQNTDLFWALRGGGGSTFGIVTSVTLKTFPTPRLEHLRLTITTPHVNDTRTAFDMIAYVLGQFPSLADQGLSGYAFLFHALPPFFDANAADPNAPVSGLFMSAALQLPQTNCSCSSCSSGSETMHRLWDPVLAHINRTWPGLFTASFQTQTFPSFLSWFHSNFDSSPAGDNSYVGSRLLDAPALARLASGGEEGSAALARFAGASIDGDDSGENENTIALATAYLVSGKGVHHARPRGGDNAVHPAWRSAYVHATCGVSVPPLNKTADLAGRRELARRVAALREVAPHTGAYVNEADPDEPGWQREFWGANYERLLRIKRAVDPDDVFWCHPCVGNERWEQVDGRLCRVRGRRE